MSNNEPIAAYFSNQPSAYNSAHGVVQRQRPMDLARDVAIMGLRDRCQNIFKKRCGLRKGSQCDKSQSSLPSALIEHWKGRHPSK